MKQTPLSKLIEKLNLLKQIRNEAPPLDEIILNAKALTKDEEKIIAEAFDEGYRSGKRIILADGKTYFEENYKQKKYNYKWNP